MMVGRIYVDKVEQLANTFEWRILGKTEGAQFDFCKRDYRWKSKRAATRDAKVFALKHKIGIKAIFHECKGVPGYKMAKGAMADDY